MTIRSPLLGFSMMAAVGDVAGMPRESSVIPPAQEVWGIGVDPELITWVTSRAYE